MGELVEVETISVQEPNIEVVETAGEEPQPQTVPLNDAVQLLYHPVDHAEGTYVTQTTDALQTDSFSSSDILTTPVAEREVVVSHLAPLTEQEEGIELGIGSSTSDQLSRKRRHEDGIDLLLWRKPAKAPRKNRKASRKSEPSRSIFYDSSAARTKGTDIYQQTRKWQRKQVQMTTLEGEFTATLWASGTSTEGPPSGVILPLWGGDFCNSRFKFFIISQFYILLQKMTGSVTWIRLRL